ncbi:OLC1v1035530C1 [Oldenlandia corymbosa var. corymbosa]|uniref:OLC1v1035530C1 n=1 Tax=Oldenlandia corymbosa var. corymbosa TaxID=529605 RepID=A0AAV1CWJ9_OLDCO|nr:OLC1v1035530C1 [Oldenlandia corymbosa var. corymbosa]
MANSFKAGDLLLFQCSLLLVLMFASCSQAREFGVGGRGSYWKIPSSPDAYNKWSSIIRFQIGDSLVLEYDANNDSVLEVSEADYNTCNKDNPIRAFHDGRTRIQLDRSGPFYFISGADGHCQQGQKLEVRVLSPRHGSRVQASPAPAPFAYAPAPAPANGGHLGLKLEIGAVVLGSLVAFALML